MKANAPLWIVSLGQGGGDAAAVGGPGAPNITNPDGGTIINFTAGEEGAAGPTLGYGASVEPEGPVLTVESDNPAVGGRVVLSETEPFIDYVVTVYGVNVAGRGKAAQTNPFQLNYNLASGGTMQTFDSYLGREGKWAVHTFNGNGTLDVSVSVNPWDILVVGGGAGGGPPASSRGGGGGGGGGVNHQEGVEIPVGAHSVTVAGGGGTSTLLGWTANGGAGGRAGWSCGGNCGYGGASGAPTAHSGGAQSSDTWNGGQGGSSRANGAAGRNDSDNAGLTIGISGQNQVYGTGGEGAKMDGTGAPGKGRPGTTAGTVIVAYRME